MRIRLAVLTALVVAAGVCLFLQRPVRLFHWRDFRNGDRAVHLVEEYRKTNHRLPETLNDVDFLQGPGAIDYQKTDNDHYVVWFGTFLGESEVYESATQQWQSRN